MAGLGVPARPGSQARQPVKGVDTPASYMTNYPPRGGQVNDCSCLQQFDKHVCYDRDARGATQLQPNEESFEFCHGVDAMA
jgi:hypothetical protein